ncbi:MAG: polysaccharide pyruvyl transferase family protein [Lachnospiraceae bacterium]|nr:polysaccharide pyruvyl transferase family protein [Lachnospiraceae bacterium]
MKKIAIVTLNHGINYGNKLQNYAVQVIYEKLGYEAETIRFYPQGLKVNEKSKKTFCLLLKKLKRHYLSYKFSSIQKRRQDSFSAFDRQYLKMTKTCYTPMTYHNINEQDYDFFAVGSDQVWNSYFFDFTPMYLLDFVKTDCKKISYAASFGVQEIAPEYHRLFKTQLSKFQAISVRETSAADMVFELCKKRAEVVIDPTLMLDANDWMALIDDIDWQVPKRYVLTYFLGELSSDNRKQITRYAREHECEIIELNQLKNDYYAVDPREFVFLIYKAFMVFTDSFHACCFSLQFEKPFWVLSRKSEGKIMQSRIDTFLQLFELEQRKFAQSVNLDQEIDYSHSEKILRKERKKGIRFLTNAFMGEEI